MEIHANLGTGGPHMVFVWPFIFNFIGNVCGLPKGSKKSLNFKRKFALPSDLESFAFAGYRT